MMDFENTIRRSMEVSQIQGEIKAYKQMIKDLETRISAAEHNLNNLLDNTIKDEMRN